MGFVVTIFLGIPESTVLAQHQSFSLNGIVLDEETNAAVSGVTLRVLGTLRGTISGGDGAFRIALPSGDYTIVVSSVGYISDTLRVSLFSDVRQTVRLKPSPVHLQEVLVMADDPGVDIIRKAIANKRKWMDLLESYEFDAYTKQVLQKDTSIASITESYTRGYWRKDDGLREVIRQRRQTENVPAARNFTIVGQILNFNEDEIRLSGYTFVGPTAPDAFDSYEYKLLRTYESKGVKIHELSIKPKSNLKPLFEGTISIADSVFAVMRVNVKPNDAFRFPFVDGLLVNYQQRFSLFDNLFWMPVDIFVTASAEVKIPGISIPRFGLEHRSVLYEYSLNPALSDSIFDLRRITVDSSVAVFDSLFWKENQVLPFTAAEEKAYRTLDSTQTLQEQFQPSGALAVVGKMLQTSVGQFDIRFNRVEGFFLGTKLTQGGLLNSETAVSLSAGYGFSNKVFQWNATLTHRLLTDPNITFGLEAYRTIDHRPDGNLYGNFLISLGSLLRKSDYRDYYEAAGWSGFISLRPMRWVFLRTAYGEERQRSVSTSTDFSLFSRDSRYRANPPIRDGKLKSISGTVEVYYPRSRRFISTSLSRPDPLLRIDVEHSSSGYGSDFDFTRYTFAFALKQSTFLSGLLFPPQLTIRVAGGTVDAGLPPQRLFDLESRYSGVAAFGALRGLHVKEFSGDRYLSGVAEHNFRSLPFHRLGLDFLEDAGIEFIVFGGVARTWLSDATRRQLSSVVRTTDGWYKEAGFGFSRILGLIRTDFTWRLGRVTGDRFFFSLSLADFF